MIKPLFNNEAVEQVVEDRKTASGILLDTVKDNDKLRLTIKNLKEKEPDCDFLPDTTCMC